MRGLPDKCLYVGLEGRRFSRQRNYWCVQGGEGALLPSGAERAPCGQQRGRAESSEARGIWRGAGGNLTGPSIHSFNKRSLSTCYLAGMVLDLTGHIETAGLDPRSSEEAQKSFGGGGVRPLGH